MISADDVLGTVDIPVAELWGRGGEVVSGWHRLMYAGAGMGEVFLSIAVEGSGAHVARVVPTRVRVSSLAARGMPAYWHVAGSFSSTRPCTTIVITF